MSYSQGQMVAMGAIFLVLPTVFVGLRIWAKTMSRAGFAWDDYLIFLSLAATIGACAVQIVAASNGQLGQHQTDGPDGMPILDDPRFLLYESCKFALQMLSYVGVGCAKSSILVFYMRIFSVPTFRLLSQIMLATVLSWTIAFFFASLFQCYPITPLVEPFYGNSCINVIPFWYAGGISDIILDFLILFMPIPMVLNLHLQWKQKMAVLFMFLLGALACAASIARLVIFFQVGAVLAVHFNDETYYTSPVFFWTVIELSLAVISTCLPTLRPIFMRFNALSTTRGGSSNQYGGSGSNPTTKSIGSRYFRNRYGRAGSMTNDDYEMPLSAGKVDGVHTHIKGSDSASLEPPREGVIVVHENISSKERPVEHV